MSLSIKSFVFLHSFYNLFPLPDPEQSLNDAPLLSSRLSGTRFNSCLDNHVDKLFYVRAFLGTDFNTAITRRR